MYFLPPVVSGNFFVGRLADGLGQQAGEDDAHQVDSGDPQNADSEFGQMIHDEVDHQTITSLEKTANNNEQNRNARVIEVFSLTI